MKKLFFSICTFALVALMTTTSFAQIKTPSASPGATLTQAIGLSDVTITYSRPSTKGRTIFAADGLVPYGKVWRTGANQATKVSFGADVSVGGKDLKKGDYAVLTIPNAGSWAVHFYPYESGSWNSYVEKTPTAIATAKVENLPFSIESFSISVEDITDDSGNLVFFWSNVAAALPLKFEVEKNVMAAIEKTLAGPTAGDYYAAGNYLLSINKDLDKALMYVQKATKGDNPRFWQVRREALILAKLGKTKEAIKAATLSKDLAAKAGNDDYVRMNEKSIMEWAKK
ncbi:MAG: DUF2911 domain-containing protein [Saprospiraceae bacterium]